MPDAIAVLQAFNTIAEQFGQNIDHIFDVNNLLRSRAILAECRRIIEERISEDYLPGFRFQDDDHAYWFLKNHGSWATWVFGYPMKPEHWDETWLRMFLVPSRLHYVAEVARALQAYDRATQAKIREYNDIKARGGADELRKAAQIMSIMRALRGLPPGPVRGERDRMSMPSWLTRIREHFPGYALPESDRGTYKLARSAEQHRVTRRQEPAPSSWQIVQLVYHGDIEGGSARGGGSEPTIARPYFERWEWVPLGGLPAPSRTSVTFFEPARRALWDAPWKVSRKKGRPSFVD